MNAVEQVDPETVKKWLDEDGAVMIDVREDEEVAAARIPGTIHIAMSRFDPEQLPDLAGRKLVLQCASGMRSDQVAQYLVREGIVESAANLAGGIQAWAQSGLPIAR